MRTTLRILQKVLAVVGALKLPEDIRGLWKLFWEYVLRPLLPGGLVGAVAYLQNAPLWAVAAWAFGVYVLTLAFGGRLAEATRKRLPTQQAGEQSTGEAFNRNRELETQDRWRGQDALDKYLDQMQQWLDDENRPLLELPSEDPRRKLARTRTLEILRRLDSSGKRSVMRFLQEQGLIKGDSAVIPLNGADFSHADLARLNLIYTNLAGVDFRGANLAGAHFCVWSTSGKDYMKAYRRGVPLDVFEQPQGASELPACDFSDANLQRANMGGCNMAFAKFDKTDLEGADLRGAFLLVARDLTQE